MPKYFISYDLNGSEPTHAEVDKHLEKKYASRQRILETVWFVCASEPVSAVYNHIAPILSANDRLIVVEAVNGVWDCLLGGDDNLSTKWSACKP